MRGLAQINIGVLSAIPFLFSLMGFAGYFYVSSLTSVVAERDEMEAKIAKARAAEHDRTTLASLEQELQQLNAALEEHGKKVGQLQNGKAKLEDKLASLRKLEEKIAQLRLSLAEREDKLKRLREEIEAIKKELAGVQREIDEKEKVQAKDLVPSGSRRPAVFMECDSRGVWIMPERRLLESSVPLAAREAFLGRARSKRYVVFLIRPDGFQSFKRYREVLETYNKTADLKLDFGYEPVDIDWKLIYPTEEWT